MQEGDDTYNCGPFSCWYAAQLISGKSVEVDALDDFDIETVREGLGISRVTEQAWISHEAGFISLH